MEIRSHVPAACSATADAGSVSSEKRAGELISMSAFFDSLKLEPEAGSDEAQVRNTLRDALGAMSPETRQETVSTLKDLARIAVGSEAGDLIDSKLPDVEKEAHKGAGIDRLLELLFMLMMMLGQANNARNGNAAKFGEISVKQAAAAGDKGINAANSNFGGALAGLVLSTAVAGVGFRQFAKGAGGQIKNISANGRGASQLRQQNTQAGSALNRQASPMTGASSQERVKTLDAQGRQVGVQNNQPHLGGDEHAVLSQPMHRTEAQINAKELALQENGQKFMQQQFGGQIVTGFAPALSSVAQGGAGIEAAAQNCAGKVNDAQGSVASSVQHNEEQAAQRSIDLLLKVFSLIVTTSEQSRSTLDSMSQAIKA